MFEFSVLNKDIIKEVAIEKVATHLCLTLIVKELKYIVEHGKMITMLNILNH